MTGVDVGNPRRNARLRKMCCCRAGRSLYLRICDVLKVRLRLEMFAEGIAAGESYGRFVPVIVVEHD